MTRNVTTTTIVRMLALLRSHPFTPLFPSCNYINYCLPNSQLKSEEVLEEAHLSIIMREVSRGLAYLHAHGIVHGDLRASRILLSLDGHVKLAGFGYDHIFLIYHGANALANHALYTAQYYYLLLDITFYNFLHDINSKPRETITSKPPGSRFYFSRKSLQLDHFVWVI